MKGLTRLLAASLAGALAFSVPAAAQDHSDWPSSLTVGTASQGGTYYVYGSGLANLIQEQLDVTASAEVTGGPVQNLVLINNGQLDVGFSSAGPAYEAWTGNNPMAKGQKLHDLRALFPMYQSAFQIMTLEGSGIDSLEDLEGHSLGVGPRAGTTANYLPDLLAELGIDVDVQYGGSQDQASQLQDGLLDAISNAAGVPVAAFSQVEAQHDARFLGMSEAQVEKLVDAHPSLSPTTVSADAYESLDETMHTVAMWNFVVAHKGMSDSLAYELTRLVFEKHDRMMQVHQSAKETLAPNMKNNGFMPVHPGALRYYQEAGVKLPNKLMPPEDK